MQTKEQLKEILVNEYLNYFLSFFMTRVPFLEEAQELAQTTACECMDSIDRVKSIENINGYFWSIAHNVYKRYLRTKNNYILDDDYCRSVVYDVEEKQKKEEREEIYNSIRESLSILSGTYRKVIVLYYYHELKIKEIAKTLNLSIEMIKYYLSSGKKKLKEIYFMEKIYGEKSFNPSDFSIYYSGIDFAKVNVWNLFKRKLPCQIAIVCFKTPKTISEIAMETGVASCYLEEEIEILLDGGLLREVVKNKFQTNFFILRKEELKIIDQLYFEMYKDYTNEIKKIFEENKEKIINTKVFNHRVSDNMYKWLFADCIEDFDNRMVKTTDADYPKILSCGARGVVFGNEALSTKGMAGQSPSYLKDKVLWARDLFAIRGYSIYQPILRDSKIAQTVVDVYNGIEDKEKENIYADLIKYHILEKKNGKLYCNVAYRNKEFKTLMNDINKKMCTVLEKKSKEILSYITNIVTKNIPDNLKDYINGYVMTYIQFFSASKLMEALMDEGFLEIEDNIQLCYFMDNN